MSTPDPLRKHLASEEYELLQRHLNFLPIYRRNKVHELLAKAVGKAEERGSKSPRRRKDS